MSGYPPIPIQSKSNPKHDPVQLQANPGPVPGPTATSLPGQPGQAIVCCNAHQQQLERAAKAGKPSIEP
ncbi:hypothetical protein VTJ04DRAFT_5024 [Mycothermus thermophilus]|uniref:uncharacterized protein n=1 Tax=Humicola insolens TaxID=85995 RepID=UPI003742502B